ncbi:hypothetical protein [Nocardioides sp. B-3]|uniref:hypothetical protein n=1 Tax=Nocardioides sp. B-3 TaxID=2895565 RepID=UPI002152686D|nr:hypothetical protein [Nocardioides sp. B-3]UUZ58853.1 hypothetical protein LP418_22710 [Nocardioides sp. B-3]
MLTPFNGNLMPGGHVIARAVGHTGLVNWTAAALSIVVMHALGALSAVWMLVTLFGRRPMILVPLILYLSSSMATPSLIWWTAAMNGLPLRVSYFLAITLWVKYLRSRRLQWVALCSLAVAGGLFFWVKAILIIPVLGFLALAYFASGSPWMRVYTVARRYPAALVLGGGLAAAYAVLYLAQTTDQSRPFTGTPALQLVGTMLGKAFGSTAVGGPWVWNNFAPPTAYAGPPMAAVTMAWILITLVVGYLWLRRTRTLRAWVLVLAYLMADVLLLLGSRAPTFGAGIGMELRYVAGFADHPRTRCRPRHHASRRFRREQWRPGAPTAGPSGSAMAERGSVACDRSRRRREQSAVRRYLAPSERGPGLHAEGQGSARPAGPD